LVNIDVFTPATGALRPEITLFQLHRDMCLEKVSILRRKGGILSSRERRVIEEEMLKELRSIGRIPE